MVSKGIREKANFPICFQGGSLLIFPLTRPLERLRYTRRELHFYIILYGEQLSKTYSGCLGGQLHPVYISDGRVNEIDHPAAHFWSCGVRSLSPQPPIFSSAVRPLPSIRLFPRVLESVYLLDLFYSAAFDTLVYALPSSFFIYPLFFYTFVQLFFCMFRISTFFLRCRCSPVLVLFIFFLHWGKTKRFTF